METANAGACNPRRYHIERHDQRELTGRESFGTDGRVTGIAARVSKPSRKEHQLEQNENELLLDADVLLWKRNVRGCLRCGSKSNLLSAAPQKYGENNDPASGRQPDTAISKGKSILKEEQVDFQGETPRRRTEWPSG
jgi:hypothetical protein